MSLYSMANMLFNKKFAHDYNLDDAFTGHIGFLRVGVIALISEKKFYNA